jgi:hypothetical protein
LRTDHKTQSLKLPADFGSLVLSQMVGHFAQIKKYYAPLSSFIVRHGPLARHSLGEGGGGSSDTRRISVHRDSSILHFAFVI